jgi:hypothetical protein
MRVPVELTFKMRNGTTCNTFYEFLCNGNTEDECYRHYTKDLTKTECTLASCNTCMVIDVDHERATFEHVLIGALIASLLAVTFFVVGCCIYQSRRRVDVV